MKAITFYRYGPPEVLHLEDIAKPSPNAEQLLVRVMTTTVNSGDWRVRKADPAMVRLFFGLTKPKHAVLGMVFSGVIEEIGPGVTHFQVGDAVFGLSSDEMGAYAEYLAIPATAEIARKPVTLSHEHTAAIVFGGHTALHFLRQADLQAGQKILIYGASGSVGSAAVQLAKHHYDAYVTGVCSTDNLDMVKALGADRVIDYTTIDIYSISERFDVVYETVNKTSVTKIANLLKPGGKLILGAALIKGMLQGSWLSARSKIKVIGGVAKTDPDDLALLGQLATEGKLQPVIDRTYLLNQMAEAHEYVEQGHKKGNVVVQVQDD